MAYFLETGSMIGNIRSSERPTRKGKMEIHNWLIQKPAGTNPSARPYGLSVTRDHDLVLIETLLRRDAMTHFGKVLYAEDSSNYGKDVIPVGDIPFVENWLYANYKKKMVPIEVPEVLRTREYLGRTYRFLDRDYLPSYDQSLKYFVKNVDRLKEFNSCLYEGRIPNPSTIPQGKYLISEWVNIRSEFRMFVHEDNILAAQHYLGAPLSFPNPDKLMKMVEAYKADDNRPKSYTMDVAVICHKDQSLDTVILEVHPFACCGLYGFNDYAIPDMLRNGIDYYIGFEK